MNEANTSVLVIDDEEMVRDNIEDILVPKRNSDSVNNLNHAANILFNIPQPLLAPRVRNLPDFSVKKASNGMQGAELVKQAVEDGHPFAVIFLDMRMPGWDGLETAMQIRKYDSQAEIIFVTAFSDRTIEDIVTKAGQNVGYHCKPYASEEIIQLATKAVFDYSRLRNLERLIRAISSISINEYQLKPLLHNILDQLAAYMGTDMALLGKLHDDYSYEKLFSIGTVEEMINIPELIAIAKSAHLPPEEVVQINEVVLARMDTYTIFAVLQKKDQLKTEKLYLLKLFVQNAAKAIRNAELQEKLLQKEKLSAVGSAMAMLMHDLRSPIGNLGMITNIMREEGSNSKWLETIDACGVQASQICNDFMDFINATQIVKKPIDLGSVINNILRNNELLEGRVNKVNIVSNIPENLSIAGDESKLKRCFINLLNNAIDALQINSVQDACIHITAEQDHENKISINFRDNGPGIPPNIIRTLFEPFVTMQKANGTGLGLAIVKQYIDAHGGSISVKNEGGAVFTIII